MVIRNIYALSQDIWNILGLINKQIQYNMSLLSDVNVYQIIFGF